MKTKKKLLAVALVVAMVATLSFSSLAWFTDNDSAKNEFIIGGELVSPESPEDIFSVDVKENVDDEKDPVDNMDFDYILPGDKFRKEAFITNEGLYDQYIRVTMTISDWNLLKNIITINMDDDFDKNWKIVSNGVKVNDHNNLESWNNNSVDSNGNLVVVMYLRHKLEPNETVQIMDHVSISAKATQADFAKVEFADGFSIDIKAEAAQTENILDKFAKDEAANAEQTFAILEGE